MYIPIRKQIIYSVGKNFDSIVQYYESVRITQSDYIHDIRDGEIYKSVEEHVLRVSNDSVKNIPLSFVVNTDGVQGFNIASDSLWPIQLTQNFLPPNIRYLSQHILLVGVFYGKAKNLPVHAFFKLLCEEFDEMSSGICLKEFSNFKFYPYVTHASVDSPAKSKIQCFTQHNGCNGCCICYTEAESVPNKANNRSTRRALFTDEPLKYRNHIDTLEIMMKVKKVAIYGIQDISPFVGFECFDLIKSFSLDYLHMILKGTFEKLCSLYFSTENNNKSFYICPKKKQYWKRDYEI